MWTIYIMIAIPGVIICTVGLLYYMHQIEPYVKTRIKREQQHKQQAVVERRTETVTEKVVIELVPNEELSKSLSNLTGSIDHHAQTLATVIETTAQIIPLSVELPRNQEQKEKNVSTDVSAIDAPKKPKQSTNIRTNKKKNVSARVSKEQIRAYLENHTWKETATDLNVSEMTISRALKDE